MTLHTSFFSRIRSNVLQQGFTLLELLVVISIIGILVAAATASFSTAQKNSRDARRKSDLQAWQNGLEQYYADNNRYPYPDNSNCDPGTNYLPTGIPQDPKNTAPYTYVKNTCNSSTVYCICAELEKAAGGNASATNCTWSAGGKNFCIKNLQ